jgi:hypothetical protein
MTQFRAAADCSVWKIIFRINDLWLNMPPDFSALCLLNCNSLVARVRSVAAATFAFHVAYPISSILRSVPAFRDRN